MGAPEFLLILTMVTPQRDIPDIIQKIPMDTLEECFAQTKAFTEHGIPKIAHEYGIVAVIGSCRSLKVEDDDDT